MGRDQANCASCASRVALLMLWELGLPASGNGEDEERVHTRAGQCVLKIEPELGVG